MSWAGDTDQILEDSGTVNIQVKAVAFDHTVIPPAESATVIETATVLMYYRKGDFGKDERGQIKTQIPIALFANTSSVAVGHRLFESGSSNYYEVLHVANQLGHKEAKLSEVKGR